MSKYLFGFLFICCTTMTSCAPKRDYVVTFHTKYGDMVAILYDETPKHKANFIKLAKEHFFDSLLFHRVIEGFMIQGGDPDSKRAKLSERLGNGGPGYTIDAEFNPTYFHEKGALSAARLGDQQNPSKASSGSQFYIVQGTKYKEEDLKLDGNKLGVALQKFLQMPENKNYYDTLAQLYQSGDMEAYQQKLNMLAPQIEKATGMNVSNDMSAEQLKAYTTIGGAPHLDKGYTVFGKVIKGLDIIDKIAAVQKDETDRPLEDVRITVTVEEMSRKKIEKEYGYQYPDEK